MWCDLRSLSLNLKWSENVCYIRGRGNHIPSAGYRSRRSTRLCLMDQNSQKALGAHVVWLRSELSKHPGNPGERMSTAEMTKFGLPIIPPASASTLTNHLHLFPNRCLRECREPLSHVFESRRSSGDSLSMSKIHLEV